MRSFFPLIVLVLGQAGCLRTWRSQRVPYPDTPGQPVEWVALPGGTFALGAEDGGVDNAPLPGVSIRGFEMSRTEVTVEQYAECVARRECTKPEAGTPEDDCNWGKKGRERHPVNCVRWDQALQFARFKRARLPSEAEWEYAARGGGLRRKYPWGDEEPSCRRAEAAGAGCRPAGTAPVCSRPEGRTPHGLCDMAGNVWEWVQDTYHPSYEGTPADGRPYEEDRGFVAYRVTRGGSFSSREAEELRADHRRRGGDPGYRPGDHGFRIARRAGELSFLVPLPAAGSEAGGEAPPGHAPPPQEDDGEFQPVEWVFLKGGTFTLGTEEGFGDDLPLPGVRIADLEFSKTEVTVEQYRECVKAGRCAEPKTPVRRDYCNYPKKGRDRHPINCVDLRQAEDFARFAGARLPSEAEWEYAARGGGLLRSHPWGEKESNCERVVMYHGGYGCGTDATFPVCSKPAGNTPQGLCDMVGNVWEWTADKYKNSYEGTPLDGRPYTRGLYQVARGGSFSSTRANRLRVDRRDLMHPDTRRCFLGFRVIREARSSRASSQGTP